VNFLRHARTAPSLHGASYRPDIDGLRAIAVLSVLGFHAFPAAVPGGFIGVDIFFVISGFLISSIIFEQCRASTFGLLEFYSRRARRIFPALIVVLIATLGLGWMIFLPSDLAKLAKAIAGAAVFISNFSSLAEQGYFDTSAELKPLLHLWSLAVEEQFYLCWPLLLVGLIRWKSGPLQAARVVCLVSFVLCFRLTRSNQAAAFYLPVSRFWELMFGCILALELAGVQHDWLSITARYRFGIPWRRFRAVASVSGLAVIAFGLAAINRDRAFPGLWALAPTFATILLIGAGEGAWINRRILSHPALVYVGLISYPLYLWHWPLLSFLRYSSVGEPGALSKISALAVSFVLADLTRRLLENPIRSGGSVRLKGAVAAGALGCMGLAGLAVFLLDGVPSRFSEAIQNTVRDHSAPALTAYKFSTCFLIPPAEAHRFADECDGSKDNRGQKVLLWGDSQAAHLAPGLRKAISLQNDAFNFSQYTVSSCPPVLGYDGKSACRAGNDLIFQKIAAIGPDIVVLGGLWNVYSQQDTPETIAEGLGATVGRLRAIGVRRIIGVGQFPLWDILPAKILGSIYESNGKESDSAGELLKENRHVMSVDIRVIDSTIRAAFIAAGAEFISPSATLCNAGGCLVAVPNTEGIPMDWDSTHLTVAGSEFFVRANERDFLH
jgi:peptidoglycan/LPS O-acetylase OafA/YrhL